MSVWHWLIVVVVIVLLFGRQTFSRLTADLAKGIKALRQGVAED